MATVTYDDRSFIIDDKRVWLVSGSMHYFRIPEELWADRLLQAKRAGLNCISTPLAWGIHEPVEGQLEVEGQNDVVEFVNLAEELGLYVILRPGPFVGAGLNFGGLPGWLAGKNGMSYRTNNAAYSHYFDKYFARILPQLSEFQVTNGANIILIQNESKYQATTMPDRLAYLEFINQMFRRSGFTVPIINCNVTDDPATGCPIATEPAVPDNIECVNGWDVIPAIRRQKHHQPDAPLLVSEFYTGQADCWGQAHNSRDDQALARRATEILGCGSQFNYDMWHGGTNFGLLAGRRADQADAYYTTSYDCDAPLAEGGGLTPKYYLTRLVNVLASSMASYFAATRPALAPACIVDATDISTLTGPTGSWVIVTNNGRKDVSQLVVALPDGRKISADLRTFGALALPFDMRLPSGEILDYCSLMPLGMFGEEGDAVLILHGPAKCSGVISVEGVETQIEIPADDIPAEFDVQGLRVIVVNSSLAMRTWPVEESIIFGPEFVGELAEDIRLPKKTMHYFTLSLAEPGSELKKVKAPPVQRAAKTNPPQLGNWKRMFICPEPISKKLEWQKLDRPKDMDKLGLTGPYGWFRIDIDQPREQLCQLFLPDCEDRASVYLNGGLIGVWGRGDGAKREPIRAKFKKGANALVMLVENLGRFDSSERLGQRKGLFGHVYDAKLLKCGKFRLKQCESFPKRIVPRNLGHLMEQLESQPVWTAEVDFTLSKVQPVHMSFSEMGEHHAAVFCNDRPLGFFASGGNNWGEVTLGADLKKGKNTVRLLLWGDVDIDCLAGVKFHSLTEPISAGMPWSYRPWALPEATVGEPILGKSCWYNIKFKHDPAGLQAPLFLKIYGSKKGLLYLNGHDLGRFWTVGPQDYYYLPECWLTEENELRIFEENGQMPSRCKLEYRPLGPYRS